MKMRRKGMKFLCMISCLKTSLTKRKVLKHQPFISLFLLKKAMKKAILKKLVRNQKWIIFLKKKINLIILKKKIQSYSKANNPSKIKLDTLMNMNLSWVQELLKKHKNKKKKQKLKMIRKPLKLNLHILVNF